MSHKTTVAEQLYQPEGTPDDFQSELAREDIKKQTAISALQIIRHVADAIREVGEIPAGSLYAVMMASGCSITQFDQIIGTLERAELVQRTPAHLLRWIGPAK